MSRFCVYDDQEVRQVTPADKKQWGRGQDVPDSVFVHTKPSEQGTPGCGRQFLTEDRTYTIGEDTSAITEPQY
jgi:hypothetical protein